MFVDAIEKTKLEYNILLEDSIVVKVLRKETLDKIVMRIFFSAKDSLYESIVEINPIAQSCIIQEFSKVGMEVDKSDINMNSDLAYGYVPLIDFSKDKNIDFLVSYLKKHYSALEGASVESVEKLELKGSTTNYKIFLKNGGEITKFIVFYEERFQRVIQIRSFSFEIGGAYEALNLHEVVYDSYFRRIDQYVKEKYPFVAEESSVVSVEKKDFGNKMGYRSIYLVQGKTYHFSAFIHQETQIIEEEYWNEIIEIPTIKNDPMFEEKPRVIKLEISDLASNIYFSSVHKEVLSMSEFLLKNSQMIGAIQRNNLFSYEFTEFFYSSIDDKYYKVDS